MKKKVKKCLLCKGSNLIPLFNVGNLFVSNFVKKKDIKKGVKSPLNLLYCKSCTLIQLSHIAPQELMYRRFYWYKSGVTKIMKDALKNIYLLFLSLLNILSIGSLNILQVLGAVYITSPINPS